MQVVDSNKEKLDIHTILTMAAEELKKDLSMEQALLAIVKETSLPEADVTQIGNTVFIGHTGKGANKSKMVGRPINVDTARNYINNMLRYLGYLQEKNITHYHAAFEGDTLVPAIKMMQKRLAKTDTQMGLGQYEGEDNDYVVFVKIGEDSLQGVA